MACARAESNRSSRAHVSYPLDPHVCRVPRTRTRVQAIGLPGYYVAVCFMDRMGRRIMQAQGFFFMFVAFLILGLALEPLEHLPILMLFIYGLTCKLSARPRRPLY